METLFSNILELSREEAKAASNIFSAPGEPITIDISQVHNGLCQVFDDNYNLFNIKNMDEYNLD